MVRVPLTDGDWLPLPLVATGDNSVLTPASLERSWVKERVEVGTLVIASPVICRVVAEDSLWTSDYSLVIVTTFSIPPISKVASTVRGTEASTSTFSLTDFLKPSFS